MTTLTIVLCLINILNIFLKVLFSVLETWAKELLCLKLYSVYIFLSLYSLAETGIKKKKEVSFSLLNKFVHGAHCNYGVQCPDFSSYLFLKTNKIDQKRTQSKKIQTKPKTPKQNKLSITLKAFKINYLL